MTVDSVHANESIIPEPQSELWLICPICKKPNPAGTLHCQSCWGPSLYSVKPVTTAEVEEINRRRENKVKRWRRIRTIIISIGAPVILFSLIFGIIYNFTDLIFPPSAQMNSETSDGDWAMFRHDLSRSGSSETGTIQPDGKVKWTFQTEAQIDSSPVVVDGTVYFGSRDYKLYAVDAATGLERWTFQTGSWVMSSPVVVDGVVYFGSNDGMFYAVDAEAGRKIWEFETSRVITASAAVADGMVFFGNQDYFVYGLDAKTGKKIWQFQTQGHIFSSPVVANGVLYVGSGDGFCYALNAKNGRFRLKFRAGEVLSSPAVDEGLVYFSSRGGLYAIDGNARNWPWEYDLRPFWVQLWALRFAPTPPPISGSYWKLSLVVNPEATRKVYVSYSNNSPVVTDDAIFITGNNILYRIEKNSREYQWLFKAGDIIDTSPALANGVIYVCSKDGILHAVDAKHGTILWDFAVNTGISSSPAVVDGVVYFGADDGKLYAIE
jgi:outer membrane protein assembly factor BamB